MIWKGLWSSRNVHQHLKLPHISMQSKLKMWTCSFKQVPQPGPLTRFHPLNPSLEEILVLSLSQ